MSSPLPTRRARPWFAALLFAAAAVPNTAPCAVGAASVRTSNAKPASFQDDICRKAPALAAVSSVGLAAPAPAAPAPSALDRIRLAQEGAAPPPAAAFQPASAESGPSPRLRDHCAPMPISRMADAAGGNSELGTTAIPVDRTRFDDRWDRVRRAPPKRLMQSELEKAHVGDGLVETETLDRINLWVNHRLTYKTDARNYGQDDVWATAAETLARGSGDCEDFAILKMQLLRAAGIGGDRVKLVLLRDLALNADHALLLVRSGAGWVALDNMTDRIYDGGRANAVRPIMSFSGERRWVHGYLDTQPVQPIAAIPAATKAPTATMADNVAYPVRQSYKSSVDDREPNDVHAASVAIARHAIARYRWLLGGEVRPAT